MQLHVSSVRVSALTHRRTTCHVEKGFCDDYIYEQYFIFYMMALAPMGNVYDFDKYEALNVGCYRVDFIDKSRQRCMIVSHNELSGLCN